MVHRLAVLSLVFTLACSAGEAPRVREVAPRTKLILGLIPEQNIFAQIERHDPLARYLSAELGLDVRLKVVSAYGDVLDDLASGKLDGAFVGSFVYALAHRKLQVVPVARRVNPDRTSTYHGLVFARKDSGIHSIEQMRGKRFAFVDRATLAGYLLPLDYFYESGVEDYEDYLGEAYFAGTHEDAIHDVLEGRADIGAAKSTVLSRLARRDPRIARDLVFLGRSPDVPENSLALRPDIDESLREGLKEALLTMHENPAGEEALRRFGALRFVETTDDDYAPVYRYAREVRLDLATYDYD